VNLAGIDLLRAQALADTAILLLEQCYEQVFDSDVIVVVIAALLFCGAKYAA
jgi:hypothetical protein